MYKNRHSGGDEDTRGWGRWMRPGVTYISMHFVQITITVRTGNLWLSNVAATFFRQTLLKLCLLEPCEKDRGWSPGRMRHRARGEDAVRPCDLSWRPGLSCAVCDSVCLWTFPGSAVNQGPFKSPWAAGESPKNNDSTGQNQQKKNKNNTRY